MQKNSADYLQLSFELSGVEQHHQEYLDFSIDSILSKQSHNDFENPSNSEQFGSACQQSKGKNTRGTTQTYESHEKKVNARNIVRTLKNLPNRKISKKGEGFPNFEQNIEGFGLSAKGKVNKEKGNTQKRRSYLKKEIFKNTAGNNPPRNCSVQKGSQSKDKFCSKAWLRISQTSLKNQSKLNRVQYPQCRISPNPNELHKKSLSVLKSSKKKLIKSKSALELSHSLQKLQKEIKTSEVKLQYFGYIGISENQKQTELATKRESQPENQYGYGTLKRTQGKMRKEKSQSKSKSKSKIFKPLKQKESSVKNRLITGKKHK